MSENEIAAKVVSAATEVHRELGPGLLESAYASCLAYELKNVGMNIKEYMSLPLIYKEAKLNVEYEIDFLVERKIIVDVKSVESIGDIHTAHLQTYLRLKDLRLGLLINFNTVNIMNGIKRIMNGYYR